MARSNDGARGTYGMGRIFQPTYVDKTTRKLIHQAIWWIEYPFRGRPKRESSKSRVASDARKLLKQRLGEIGTGQFVGRDAEKTTFEDLMEFVENHYVNNGLKSLDQLKTVIRPHLEETFEGARAVDITTDRIESYKAAQRKRGFANATINRDLAALKRGFRLAHRSGKVAVVPYIGLLKEDNARKGFFEADEFRRVLAELPTHLRVLFQVAYITGWRLKSELLTRQWSHVDLEGEGWLRIEPGEDKNRSGRMFAFTPELRKVLKKQRAHTKRIERELGKIIPWVFHYEDGEPIKSIRAAWKATCAKAKVFRLPHDFRRTAVRNLERAGVPRSVAMAMVGHKTESIYRRYAIVDEGMLRMGADKLAVFQATQPRRKGAVVSFPKHDKHAGGTAAG